MTPAETSRKNLVDHGLPAGLLPANVAAVDHDHTTGRFEVELDGEIRTEVGGYMVRYRQHIRGTLRPGAIEGLSGVQAKRGLWFPVTGMVRKGDAVAFQVGPVVKHLPLSAFEG